jgi:integrase
MPSEPKGSTLRNHASAYNRVIKTARQQGYIHDNKPVPILSAVGEKGSPRPAFNKEEIEYLLKFMPEWEQGGFMPIFSDFRKLCRCYVEFLLYTGIRQGTESLPLRWLHFQWHWIGDKRYLRIWVSGKTGPRYLIARPAVIDTLNRLIKIQKLPYQNLDEVIAARLDKPIFVTHEGHKPRSFESVFRNLMNSSGLRKDIAGKFRSLYSLRHTYATFALTEGIDIHTLAKQMGTSINMIERHYSKITPMLSAEKLAY